MITLSSANSPSTAAISSPEPRGGLQQSPINAANIMDTFEILLSYMESLNRLIPVCCSTQYSYFFIDFFCFLKVNHENYQASYILSQQLLNQVRATRDRFSCEKLSAERRLHEAYTLLRLCEYQHEQALRKLEAAEYCVGEVRARLRSNSLPIHQLEVSLMNNVAYDGPQIANRAGNLETEQVN
jgi:hypothetical protein